MGQRAARPRRLRSSLAALHPARYLARDQDQSQVALAKKLEAPQQLLSMTFRTTSPRFRKALTAARAACGAG